MQLSIVATLYASARHVDAFCARMLRAAEAVADDLELILVNDASPDESARLALAWHARDRRVRVLDLSRNYGHYPAILAGLARARGERVFLIDVDLEEPPELLGPFWAALDADPELDVVVGVQQTRRGGWWERASGAAFYRLLNAGSARPITPDTLVARLMTRRFVAALLALPERPVSLDLLSATTGFRQLAFPTEKGASSATTYTFGRKLTLAVRAVLVHHEALPWYLVGAAALMGLAGLLLTVRAVALAGVSIAALTSGGVWIVGALLMAALGLIAHYLVLLLDEVRRRPTIVRREYTRD